MILNEFFNINENDPELERRFSSARKHYSHLHKPQDVMNKLFQRSMLHSEEKDADHDAKFQRLSREIEQIKQQLASLKQQQQQKELNEFARDDFDDNRRPHFLPWEEFISDLNAILDEHFSVVQSKIKNTIKAKFVPHDPMEFGPTMLYSYYDTRAGRTGANSKRGAIQVGKFVDNPLGGENRLLSSFSILKGHPFERHFDLTGANVQKIADIIIGNTAGAYQMKQVQK